MRAHCSDIRSLHSSFSSLRASAPARAQVGSTTDIIMGTVTGPDNNPVAGARVEVKSVETGITRRRRRTRRVSTRSSSPMVAAATGCT
jgi:hypothetical protein